MEKQSTALPSALGHDVRVFNPVAMLLTVLFLLAGCSRQSGPVSSGQPAADQLISKFGKYHGVKQVWDIKVSEGLNGLEISRSNNLNNVSVKASDGSTVVWNGQSVTSEQIQGWQANPGWFVYVENETFVWYFDGKAKLELLKQDQIGSASYSAPRFPRPIPAKVLESLPESVENQIVAPPAK